MIAQANATLTKIERGGTSEDYDSPKGGGSNEWLGISRCYVGVRSATLTEGNVLNRTKVTYVLVDAAIVGTDIEPGDTLTIDGETHTVREVRNRQVDTLPLQPIRLDLEDE